MPASYRSGRFEEWKAKSHANLPRVGEEETESSGRRGFGSGGRKFKHNAFVVAKPLDKFGTGYERKVRQLRKKSEAVEGAGDDPKGGRGESKKTAAIGRYGGRSIGRVKSELKTTDQIRKNRKITEQKRAKNARPSRSRKGRH